MTLITQVRELNLDSIECLRVESLNDGWRFVERLFDDWSSGANRFNGPGEAIFVAVDGNRVVGICGLNRDPFASDEQTGRVRRMYVAQAYRGRGIGGALLDAVIEHARNHFRTLRVRTEAASNLYTGRGFQSTSQISDATHVLKL